MALEPLQRTIEQLREAIQDAPTSADERGHLLFNWACRIAIELDQQGLYVSLNSRASKFLASLESKFYCEMCEIAIWLVSSTYRRLLSPASGHERMRRSVALLDQLVPKRPDTLEQPAHNAFTRPIEEPIRTDLLYFCSSKDALPWGADLPIFIDKLKRIFGCFGQPADLGRVISYFDNLMSEADQEDLRGSFLIAACFDSSRSEDSLHSNALWRNWLAADFHRAAGVMLAAAEIAIKAADRMAPPLRESPNDIDQSAKAKGNTTMAISAATECVAERIKVVEDAEVQHESLPSETFEKATTIAPRSEKQESKQQRDKYQWHPMDEEPDEAYEPFDTDRPFYGQQWQIAWALGEKKIILPKCTWRAMKTKLINKMLLGKREENSLDVIIYVHKTYSTDHISDALKVLEAIKKRGWYRHESHPLPRTGYKANKMCPLKSKSEDILARVLFANFGSELLVEPTPIALRTAIENEGQLFARFVDNHFVLYLHDKYPLVQVKELERQVKQAEEKKN